jgi:hypothetical protein
MILSIGKRKVAMLGKLTMTRRIRALNCCKEFYRPNWLNLRPKCFGFQRPLQSKSCPMFSVHTKFCDPGRGLNRSPSRSYNVWVLLLTSSVQEKNLSHNRVDGHSVLSQEIQTMKAQILINRWDRHRPHHSLILERSWKVYWFMSQNDKKLRIIISYAHITLILITSTPKLLARTLHGKYLPHERRSILERSKVATKYQSNRVTK